MELSYSPLSSRSHKRSGVQTNIATSKCSDHSLKNSTHVRYGRTKGSTEAWSADRTRTKPWDLARACWRFMRPHTIYGTVLGSSALFVRSLIENSIPIEWSLVFTALSGLFALICGNGYIVGINQIYDIEIDKVNKPDLPMASGDLSMESAWLLVIFFFVAGLSIVASTCGPLVTCVACTGLFLGTLYSVPPLRLRRFPVAAFLIISFVRGFLLNFGVSHAISDTLGLPFQWSAPSVFITTFVTVFALVIAITKDLPDVEGDTKFQVSTLATKLGVRNIAYLGAGLLLLNYVASILLAAFYMPQAFRRSFVIPVHSILAISLIYQGNFINMVSITLALRTHTMQVRVLEQANFTKEASTSFYKFIWKLFYAEYIAFPFI